MTMNSIFIPGLSQEEIRKLNESGVNADDFQIRNERGVLISEEYLASVLKTLEMRQVGNLDSTQYTGIVRAKLRSTNDKAATISFPSWNPVPSWIESIRPFIEEMMGPTFDRDVIVRNYRRMGYGTTTNNDNLNVYLYSDSDSYNLQAIDTQRPRVYRHGSNEYHVMGEFDSCTFGQMVETFQRIFATATRQPVISPLEVQKEAAINLDVQNYKWFESYRCLPPRLVQQVLAKTLSKGKLSKICLRGPYNGFAPSDNLDKNTLYLFLQATPSPNPQSLVKSFPDRILGYRFENRNGFNPSGNGEEVVDEKSNLVLAEIIGHNQVYLLFNCLPDSNDGLALFELVMNQVSEVLLLSPDERASLQKERLEAKKQEKKKAFVGICRGHSGFRLTELKNNLEEAGNTVKKLQADLTALIRQHEFDRKQLEALSGIDGSDSQMYEREFESILAIPQITDIEVTSKMLTVWTDTLNCTDPRTNIVHEIGRFRIEIDIVPSAHQDPIRWINLTKKIYVTGLGRKMEAPHIREGGFACYGNYATTFPNLIARYEFSTVVQIAIEFVQSVNVKDEWGRHINTWPVATKKPKK